MGALWQRARKTLATPTPALLAIALVIGLYAIPSLRVHVFGRLESASYDLRLLLESRVRPMPQAPEIALIAIDDSSQELVGRWPWPRQIWADVVERLTELGAHAVFFDITFPEPVQEVFQTRSGRVRLQDAVDDSIRIAEQTILEASRYDSRVTTAVPPLLVDGFRELRTRLSAILPSPDRVVADSLTRARRAGVLTGGVATVLVPEAPERARAAVLRERALAQVAADPTRPVTPALELWRRALVLFREEDSPELFGPDVTPELRDHAMHNLHTLRRLTVDAHVRRSLGDAPLAQVDPDALFERALPASYQASRMGRTLFEQSLSNRLLAEHHLLDVPGRERLTGLRSAPDMLLPTFTLARGYDFVGTDFELRDPDGALRAVPLLWDRDGRSLPAGGLALFLRVLAGPGRLPKLGIEPGPVLAIERLAQGQPTGQPPLRVPLNAEGDMLVHWAGPFASTFQIVPAATVVNLAALLRDREEYLSKLAHNRQFEETLRLRDRAAELELRAPDRKLSLAALVAQVIDAPSTAGLAQDLATSKLAGRPTSAGEERLPAAWHAFLVAYLQERELGLLSAFKFALDAIGREPDPDKRAAKQKKYATMLAPYFRYVHKADGMRRDLEARLRGKICIIGHTAASSTDLGSIAFESLYPKVGSYANVYNTLASERFLSRPGWLAWRLGGLVDPAALQLPLLLLVTFALAFILPGLTSFRGFLWAAAFSAAWFLAATALFVLAGVWVDMVAPTLGAALTYIFVVTARNRRTERVRSMFETYVDPRIVKVVVEDESRWRELGGHETRITAFFSDIANFTTLSEMLSPQEVSQMLTDYLSPMTDIILAHDGTRDKYIGDAIVAFFGAPLPGEGHELQACLASIAQQERVRELKEKWRADGTSWYAKLLAAGTDLSFRIGLNTGQAKVGNFGSLTSKSYTMIGDSVNLASRLEGANKEYGTLIMASDTTVAACGGKLVTRELDRLVVKGRREAVRVFEVIGRVGQVAAHWPALLELYERAVAAYHGREFERAAELLTQLLARWPDDGPARVYLARCAAFAAAPPPPDWDGSHHMTHK